MPFTDEEHRRYWLAYHESAVVGILILAHTGEHYVIKNCASFPDAPRGTSEALIHRGLESIHAEEQEKGHSINVSFGITASDGVKPVDNLSGWKITSLSKVYSSVTSSAGLLKRADFRVCFRPCAVYLKDANHSASPNLTLSTKRCMCATPKASASRVSVLCSNCFASKRTCKRTM